MEVVSMATSPVSDSTVSEVGILACGRWVDCNSETTGVGL